MEEDEEERFEAEDERFEVEEEVASSTRRLALSPAMESLEWSGATLDVEWSGGVSLKTGNVARYSGSGN